jgi:hypothetical protein
MDASASRKNTCTSGHVAEVGDPQGAGERDGSLKLPHPKVGDGDLPSRNGVTASPEG